MAYSKNPFLPRVRMAAVLLVRSGWSVRKTARRMGVSPGTVSKWMQKAPRDGREGIPTKSSRPHASPNAIDCVTEEAIIEERKRTGRCGQVIHEVLRRRGIVVSLSTVQRVLDRHGLTKSYSPWKRRHASDPRPEITSPGALVELDTIHIMVRAPIRIYVYALIDVCSRWAWAWTSERINVWQSVAFVRRVQTIAPFPFAMLQSDHGPEFSQHFSERIGIPHRHSRVRKPNDNAHIERFNRTIQDECLRRLVPDVRRYNAALKLWLPYYNSERLHMGINYQTPVEKLNELFPRS